MASVRPRFADLDLNKDGGLDKKELEAGNVSRATATRASSGRPMTLGTTSAATMPMMMILNCFVFLIEIFKSDTENQVKSGTRECKALNIRR